MRSEAKCVWQIVLQYSWTSQIYYFPCFWVDFVLKLPEQIRLLERFQKKAVKWIPDGKETK